MQETENGKGQMFNLALNIAIDLHEITNHLKVGFTNQTEAKEYLKRVGTAIDYGQKYLENQYGLHYIEDGTIRPYNIIGKPTRIVMVGVTEGDNLANLLKTPKLSRASGSNNDFMVHGHYTNNESVCRIGHRHNGYYIVEQAEIWKNQQLTSAS